MASGGWLDVFFKFVQYLGVTQTVRPYLNFVGSGVSVADNASNNSTDVTINAPAGFNLALTGDVTTPGGGSQVTTVAAISGTTPIAISPNELQWASGATPKLSQTGTGPLNGKAKPLSFNPQPANAGGNSSAGDVNVKLGAPTGSGAEAGVFLWTGANQFCGVKASDANGYSQPFFYLGSPATGPTTSNYIIRTDSQDSWLNAVSGAGQAHLAVSDTKILSASNSTIFLHVGLFTIDAAVTTPVWKQAAASGNGQTTRFSAQSSNGANGNGGTWQLTGGDLNGSGLRGPVQVCLGAASPQPMVEVSEVVAGQRVVALCRASAVTSTQAPTGDGVVYVANAATNPSSNPVSGGILYSNAGALTWRGTSGTTTAMGPA